MHKAKCKYCGWEGEDEHRFLGSANLELYRHLDESNDCALKFDKDEKEKAKGMT